ncbi:hypothetical protein JW905_04280 [bacterium]|nr:hypothetical protein [candidate division CSSED10-310 bacterium]
MSGRIIPFSVMLVLLLAGLPASAGSLLFDVSTGITWGDFTVQDVTADISTEYFNPSLSAEFAFGEDDMFAVGVGYAKSGNDFTGEWEDGDEHTDGEITVERTTLDLFARLRAGPHFNFKLGYRSFKYEFSDGELDKYEFGELYESERNAKATGDLTTGLDAELNFMGGNDFQFRFQLGFSYFFDAEYDWEYDRIRYDPYIEDRNEGNATANAVSFRLKPEFAFRLTDNLMATIDYTFSATAWDADTDQENIEDYPGVEIYSAFGIGLEFRIPLHDSEQDS